MGQKIKPRGLAELTAMQILQAMRDPRATGMFKVASGLTTTGFSAGPRDAGTSKASLAVPKTKKKKKRKSHEQLRLEGKLGLSSQMVAQMKADGYSDEDINILEEAFVEQGQLKDL